TAEPARGAPGSVPPPAGWELGRGGRQATRAVEAALLRATGVEATRGAAGRGRPRRPVTTATPAEQQQEAEAVDGMGRGDRADGRRGGGRRPRRAGGRRDRRRVRGPRPPARWSAGSFRGRGAYPGPGEAHLSGEAGGSPPPVAAAGHGGKSKR